MKHTPGPWKVDETEPPHGPLITVRTAIGNEFVADVTGFQTNLGTYSHRSEERANAILIAAAPELLEALKGILICVGSYANSGEFPSPSLPEFQAARNAIQKAEGK